MSVLQSFCHVSRGHVTTSEQSKLSSLKFVQVEVSDRSLSRPGLVRAIQVHSKERDSPFAITRAGLGWSQSILERPSITFLVCLKSFLEYSHKRNIPGAHSNAKTMS